jgi:hypothetical protein
VRRGGCNDAVMRLCLNVCVGSVRGVGIDQE